jgi:hypothetical protein
MSDYEIEERPAVNILSLVLNIFTVVVLLGVLCVGAIFLTIFFNPQTSMNPFPPPTAIPTLAPPTATPEAGLTLPPTNTLSPPTETPVPQDTSTPEPTEPPTATPTRFVIISRTPVPVTEEPDMSGVSFELREGSPIALQNFVHLEDGCNWMGVAGHAFSLEGNPLTTGITVQLGGFLAGSSVDLLSVTGFATQYGEGGYEFILADRPIATSNTLYVQLLDQAGLPLSEKIFFDTYEDCERNLILIDFQQFR